MDPTTIRVSFIFFFTPVLARRTPMVEFPVAGPVMPLEMDRLRGSADLGAELSLLVINRLYCGVLPRRPECKAAFRGTHGLGPLVPVRSAADAPPIDTMRTCVVSRGYVFARPSLSS